MSASRDLSRPRRDPSSPASRLLRLPNCSLGAAWGWGEGAQKGGGLTPGSSPQGTRWPWTCPPCITAARCCGTRCPCWGTASTGTSSGTARRSGGWVSSDTTSQVNRRYAVSRCVHTARLTPPARRPREASARHRGRRPRALGATLSHRLGFFPSQSWNREKQTVPDRTRSDGLDGSGACDTVQGRATPPSQLFSAEEKSFECSRQAQSLESGTLCHLNSQP